MNILLGILICFFPLTIAAQVSSIEQTFAPPDNIHANLRQLLQSDKSPDQAWGAYLVGKHQLRELIPTLEEKLKLRSSGASWNELLVQRVILDTLILLGAQIPAEKLVPLYRRFPSETLILLAKSPEQNQKVLLSLFEQTESCSQWLPLGTLLATRKAPELALALLQQLQIEVKIFVKNTKSEEGGLGYPAGYAGAILIFPKDFPPIAFYDFTFFGGQASFVFATGRQPIYYNRNIYEHEKGRPISENRLCQDHTINSYRLEFLAELLNVDRRELGLRAPELESVVWRGERQCQREFERIKLKLETSYRRLVRRLVKANLLTAQSAKILQPNISIEYFDNRKNQKIPLPKI